MNGNNTQAIGWGRYGVSRIDALARFLVDYCHGTKSGRAAIRASVRELRFRGVGLKHIKAALRTLNKR